MRFTTLAAIAVASFVLVLASGAPVAAQSWSPPSPDERCPSKWGAGDERGAANHMGPETVLRAASLIRTDAWSSSGRCCTGRYRSATGTSTST